MLTQLESIVTSPRKNQTPTLATVLYEDLAAGLRARALMECVERSMDVPAHFKLELWRYDWLGEQSLANVALSMAKRSALVLISASSANALPPVAEKWVNAWAETVADQAFASPLIALLPGAKHRNLNGHPLHEQLLALVEQKDLDFFCEYFEPQSEVTETFPLRRSGREEIFGSAPRLHAAMAGAGRRLNQSPANRRTLHS